MQAVNTFFKTLVDLIGPGAVVEYPRENDGYAGKEYKYWRMVFVSAPISFLPLVPRSIFSTCCLLRGFSQWRSEGWTRWAPNTGSEAEM